MDDRRCGGVVGRQRGNRDRAKTDLLSTSTPQSSFFMPTQRGDYSHVGGRQGGGGEEGHLGWGMDNWRGEGVVGGQQGDGDRAETDLLLSSPPSPPQSSFFMSTWRGDSGGGGEGRKVNQGGGWTIGGVGG